MERKNHEHQLEEQKRDGDEEIKGGDVIIMKSSQDRMQSFDRYTKYFSSLFYVCRNLFLKNNRLTIVRRMKIKKMMTGDEKKREEERDFWDPTGDLLQENEIMGGMVRQTRLSLLQNVAVVVFDSISQFLSSDSLKDKLLFRNILRKVMMRENDDER